ncbi:putative aldouronate transport system substrate-binding protein [Anaerotaenia torta]|uniref:ABC transporter substrate-binding protein n=1 Tax=Anaerotaenia torta TaxID=433293 RepID=UPI003D20DE65
MKRKMALLLTLMLVLSTIFAGCSKGSNENKKNTDSPGTANEATATPAGNNNTSGKETVTLKWIAVGSGMPDNYDAWLAQINPYLEEKIGVNIDMEVVSWGDWGNRRNILVNSGEYFDILFTDGSNFTSDAALGAYYDIKDIIKTSAPDLYSYIPEDYWSAVSINGSVYGIPTYKDSSMSNFIVWDKAMADKYSIDYKNIHTLEALTEPLKKITEGEGIAAFPMDQNGLSMIFSLYDSVGLGIPCVGVRYDDGSRTVVNALEQEDIMSQLKIINEWYKAGIINPDAPSTSETPTYKAVSIAQGWPSAAKTTWGPNMGVEAEAIQINDTIVSNETVRGSVNAIYSGAKYPEKCLEFLQLVNLDSKVRDAFYFGVEGENFKYTDDGKIERLNTDWKMAGYTQGTFFTVSQLTTDEFNQWDEVKALNEGAKPSVLLGFNADYSNIQNELANCREVYNKYKSELLTGAAAPEETAAKITKELKAAGLDTILTEVQNQINAYYK